MPDDALYQPDPDRVAALLRTEYGITAQTMAPTARGTETYNYRVESGEGPLFVKVYPPAADLDQARRAAALAHFTARAGLPVPALHPTTDRRLTTDGDPPLSVWEFVPHTGTAESGFTGTQWEAAGAALGHLHRVLAAHPDAAPVRQPAYKACDFDRGHRRLTATVEGYRAKAASGRPLTEFEAWAQQAAAEKLALLPRIAPLLDTLPALTVQIVHGDLTTPNLLLDGDDVAAIVDFRPTVARFAAWELARLGADPRSILATPHWLQGLARFTAAYRDAHPHGLPEDLTHMIAVGACYTINSTYPLAEPLRAPATVDKRLETYARARHAASMTMLRHLEDTRLRMAQPLR
ncbi:phosphotransferase enzyme family protein [Streptomyces polyrhachis]|uniref:Phosphotransferase enzyme family protein n=1 Tax=Streptomyces polyrhachis TaxID=1282885 RepID=A0ABW2GL20_9ACTN